LLLNYKEGLEIEKQVLRCPVSNQVELKLLKDSLHTFKDHMSSNLKRNDFEINFFINEALNKENSKRNPYTAREKFDYLNNKNPNFAKNSKTG